MRVSDLSRVDAYAAVNKDNDSDDSDLFVTAHDYYDYGIEDVLDANSCDLRSASVSPAKPFALQEEQNRMQCFMT